MFLTERKYLKNFAVSDEGGKAADEKKFSIAGCGEAREFRVKVPGFSALGFGTYVLQLRFKLLG